MKLSLVLITVAVSLLTFAQTTSIQDIKGTEDTTISIKKGAQTINDKAYEVVDGTGEIEGDPNVLQTAARADWKKACETWKNEIKELNKENQILVLNCNAPNCKTEASGTLCKSTGSYTLKIKVTK